MAFDVKITTIFRPLDLLAPFTCRGCGALGEILCERCKKYNITLIPKTCPRCKAKCKDCQCKVPIYAVSKREGILVDLVEDYKYKSIRRASEVLSELMDAGIQTCVKGGGLEGEVIVVPLPTVAKHIRERGFDHTLLLAKKLVKRHKEWKISKALVRYKNTVQVGTDGNKRRKQAKNAYKLNKRIKINPTATYLLVDDVWTTGASIDSAVEKMKAAGAKKIAAAVILIP